jgi:hypothetical protein
MRRVVAAIGLCVLLLPSPSAALARGTVTAGFRTVKSRPMSLAVLPPRAEFLESGTVVTGRMPDECAALEREAGVAVRTNLEMLGYRVRLLTPKDLEKDARLRDLAAKVGDRFSAEWRGLVARPQSVRQSRVIAGDDAARLADLLDLDGLVVARVVAVAQKEEAAPVPGAVPRRSYGRVDVGIVSGRTGRVEAFFTGMEGATLGQLLRKPAKVMGRATENALSLYPASNEPGTAAEEIPVPASEKPGKGRIPPHDAAALRDLEALIKGTPASAEQAASATAQKAGPGAAQKGAPAAAQAAAAN